MKSANLLKVIDTPVDIDREIAHLSYIEVKKDDSKALLFTNPTWIKMATLILGLTNTFGSFEAF